MFTFYPALSFTTQNMSSISSRTPELELKHFVLSLRHWHERILKSLPIPATLSQSLQLPLLLAQISYHFIDVFSVGFQVLDALDLLNISTQNAITS